MGKRNNFVIAASNHFISVHLRHLGIPVVPVEAVALPWSEHIIMAHLFYLDYTKGKVFMHPPGGVTSHLLMHHACDDWFMEHEQ